MAENKQNLVKESATVEYKDIRDMAFKALDEPGSFEGIAAIIGVEDLGGDVIEPGALDKTVSENPEIKILLQHQSGEVIGSGSVSMADDTLMLSGKLDMDDPVAQKTYSKMKKGLIKGLSIGYQALKVMWEETKEGYIRHITELKLWEISVVTFPMQPAAQVVSVKRHPAPADSIDGLLAEAQRERKEGRRLSSATMQKIQQALESLQALLAEESDTSDAKEAVTGERAAAAVPPEPGDHSVLVQIPSW